MQRLQNRFYLQRKIVVAVFLKVHLQLIFINHFKTNLQGDERDWDLERQQDAAEFMGTFLDNISKRTKETPRSFFKTKPFELENKLINFVETELRITENYRKKLHSLHRLRSEMGWWRNKYRTAQ